MLQLNLPYTIETERLFVRRLRYEDAEEMFYVYASKAEATKYMIWPTHQSIQETRRFLDYALSAWGNGTEYSYSIRRKDSSLFVGSFGIVNNDGNVSFGYILGPNHWLKGYATEVCKAVIQILKSTPGVYRIGAVVDVDNVASSRVLQKCGLVQEARLTKWLRFINQNNKPKDCLLYQLPLPHREED